MSKYEHETRVGRYVVLDSGVQCALDDGGHPDPTLADIARYEQRAARTVLRAARDADGSVLRFARKAMGLRQKELAQILGVTESTVSRWESGDEPFLRTTQLAVATVIEDVEQYGVEAVKGWLAKGAPPVPQLLRAG